jgi:GcrA cell cycle regulator
MGGPSNPPDKKHKWRPEIVELMVALWDGGQSAGQIALQLGPGYARNDVIGKLWRLGKRSGGKRSGVNRSLQRKKAAEARAAAKKGAPAPLPAIVEAPVVAIPESRRVTLLEVGPGLCRFPLGDPQSADFVFCGADAKLGEAYCAAHAAIAYYEAPRAPGRKQRAKELAA